MESVIAIVMSAWSWLGSPQGALLFAALFAVSEFLGTFEFFKSSSVFSYVKSSLVWLKGKVFPQA